MKFFILFSLLLLTQKKFIFKSLRRVSDYSRRGFCFYIHIFKEDLFNSSRRDPSCTLNFLNMTHNLFHTQLLMMKQRSFWFVFCLLSTSQNASYPIFEAPDPSRRWPQASSPPMSPRSAHAKPSGPGYPQFHSPTDHLRGFRHHQVLQRYHLLNTCLWADSLYLLQYIFRENYISLL